MYDVTEIAKAIKEMFNFGNTLADGEQQQDRLTVRTIKKLKKACNVSEKLFIVIEEELIPRLDIADEDDLAFIETFRKLRAKFNKYD